MGHDTTSIELHASGLVPIPSAEGAQHALKVYLAIQRVFDEQMPDAIMEIKGKKFRKKAYWRAIATAFNVSTEIVSIVPLDTDDDDWGYHAVIRATTTDGRISDGDGSCMASEKVDRDGNPTAMQTVHNIKSHAVTRAKNRAISDLVGFGEVSADELGPDAFQWSEPAERQVPHAPTSQPSGKAASEKQLKLLYAKSMSRAGAVLDSALANKVTPQILGEKETREQIARLARERVGCGEVILSKEVDPILVAIELIDLNAEGVLGYVGAL